MYDKRAERIELLLWRIIKSDEALREQLIKEAREYLETGKWPDRPMPLVWTTP